MLRVGMLLIGGLLLALSPLSPKSAANLAWATRPCAHVVVVHIDGHGIYSVDDRATPRDEVVSAVSSAVKAAACSGEPIAVSAEAATIYGDLIWLLNKLEAAGFKNVSLLLPPDAPGQPI